MNAKTFFKKYQGRELEDWGSSISDEFRQFAKDFKSVVATAAKEHGMEIKGFRVGHYDVSGFLHKNGKYVYFSYSEMRYMPMDLTRKDPLSGILYRTAESEKDFRGGMNCFTNIECFEADVAKLME